jgi:hypothetical protein
MSSGSDSLFLAATGSVVYEQVMVIMLAVPRVYVCQNESRLEGVEEEAVYLHNTTLDEAKQHVASRVLVGWSVFFGAHRITHTSAYVSIRQHTSAYVSIRQHTSVE